MYQNNRFILKINYLILCLYAVSYLVYYLFHFPYFLYIFGLPIFFIIGFNLTWLMEQATKLKTNLITALLWTLLFSFFITPTVVYAISLFLNNFGDLKITLGAVFSMYLLSFLGLSITMFFNKKTNTATPTSLAFLKKHPVLIAALITFFLVITVNLLIYPFIPEADPYVYLIKIREILSSHKMPGDEARPIFLSLVWSLTLITKIPAYWLFKLIFPMLSGLLVVVFYSISSSITKNKTAILLSSLVFLSFPVIVMEILVTRPQSIFLITLPVFLYIIVDILKSKEPGNIAKIAILMLFSLIGIKIHVFFLFNLLLLLATIIAFFWKLIIKYPILSSSIGLLLLVLVYPWLVDLGFVSMIMNFVPSFINYLIHPQLNLWFIDNYKNVDGNQMGWPGFTAVLYYGYNLGPLVLPVFIYAFYKAKKLRISSVNKTYLGCFIFFFMIAEIFPRVGLAYLPDRAWLFVAMSLVLLAIPSIAFVFNTRNKKVVFTFMVLFGCSICLSFFITWAKGGWTAKSEYESAMFLKNNVSENSYIVSQAGNFPMIEYFSDRNLIVPDKQFFLSNSDAGSVGILTDKPYSNLKKNENNQLLLKSQIENRTGILFSEYFASYNPTTNAADMKEYLELKKEQKKIQEYIDSIEKNDKYILYSEEKFNSLYGTRTWWRDFNFYSANLKKFDNSPDFKNIYSKNKVKIWKIIQ